MRFRLPERAGAPSPITGVRDGPVLVFLPARNEEMTIAEVVARVPRAVRDRPVTCVVIDDNSTDGTHRCAVAAGAEVITVPPPGGLGAAVRTGLGLGVARGASVIAFLDADCEYDPSELERLCAPVLDGVADYVVGSRFTGRIESMRVHRRIGNRVLTRWMAWLTRMPITDAQSGFRALAGDAAEAAEIPHDYNYAQVLTVGLLARGWRYAEVPVTYHARTTGRSFVRLAPYLRAVAPAVHRQLGRYATHPGLRAASKDGRAREHPTNSANWPEDQLGSEPIF